MTSRYTLVVGGKSYLFDSDNQVTVDRTRFTFNPLAGGIYTVTYAALDAPAGTRGADPDHADAVHDDRGRRDDGGRRVQQSRRPERHGARRDRSALYLRPGPRRGDRHRRRRRARRAPCRPASASSPQLYGYVIGFDEYGSGTGAYTVNGAPMFPYTASTTGTPASYPLMTAPQMFTLGGNFYTFDQDATGDYLSVTGNGQTIPINPYQFSLNGAIYIINTNVQPNTVVGGGNTYTMTAGNTQFVIDGVQYTITLKAGSLNGATISGQFNITQGNVVVIENYVYQLDILNGQIVGNGTAYPLTTSGFTYYDHDGEPELHGHHARPNATHRHHRRHRLPDQRHHRRRRRRHLSDPAYRTFADGAATYQIGLDGTVDCRRRCRSPRVDAADLHRRRRRPTRSMPIAAFDGDELLPDHRAPAAVHAPAGSPTQLRTDGVAITAGPARPTSSPTGPLEPNQFQFGTETIFFGRPTDIAAFDGTNYYAIANNEFTDTTTGTTFTLSGNTAVNEGNSYEIYSNLGPGRLLRGAGRQDLLRQRRGRRYRQRRRARSTRSSRSAAARSRSRCSTRSRSAGQHGHRRRRDLHRRPDGGADPDRGRRHAHRRVLHRPGHRHRLHLRRRRRRHDLRRLQQHRLSLSGAGHDRTSSSPRSWSTTAVTLAVDSEATPTIYPVINNQFIAGTAPNTTTYTVNVAGRLPERGSGPYWPMVNGRFIVPQTAPIRTSPTRCAAASVIKGYVISNDDQFSADGNIVYTVNAVNVVKADEPGDAQPDPTLTAGAAHLHAELAGRLRQHAAGRGSTYNTASSSFTVSYNGSPVTYTVAGTDGHRQPQPVELIHGDRLRLAGDVHRHGQRRHVHLRRQRQQPDHRGAPLHQRLLRRRDHRHHLLHRHDQQPRRGDLLPAGDDAVRLHRGQRHHLPDPLQRRATSSFPVDLRGERQRRRRDGRHRHLHRRDRRGRADRPAARRSRPTRTRSRSTATSTRSPARPTAPTTRPASVVGDAMTPKPFLSANTFKLTDPTVTYTLQLDANDLPDSDHRHLPGPAQPRSDQR